MAELVDKPAIDNCQIDDLNLAAWARLINGQPRKVG